MNKKETLAFLKSGKEVELLDWERTVSEWVIEEWRTYRAKAFPYNDAVRDAIVAKHHLKLSESELSELGSLVYNAAATARERDEKAAGWVKPTEDWLEARIGKKVEVLGESLLGNAVKTATVKRMGERLYLVPPRCRNKAYSIHSVKVRDLVPGREAGVPVAKLVSSDGKVVNL